MQEPADNKLRERIIEVFDSYDDSGAEQGWLKLRKKYPEKPVRNLIFWWSSAAAILMIFGTFLLLNRDSEITTNNKLKDTSENTSKQSDLTNKAPVEVEESPEITGFENPDKSHKGIKQENSDHVFLKDPEKVSLIKPQGLELTVVTPGEMISPVPAKPLKPDSVKLPLNELNALNTRVQEPASTIIPTGTILQPHPEPTGPDSIIKDQVKITASELLNDRTNSQTLPKIEPDLKEKKETSPNKRLGLSFYAGTFFNYAEGSKNPMNLGAGISSDIFLNTRFRLIAGVSLAKNNLIFENSLPGASYDSFSSSFALSSSQGPAVVPQISKFEAQLLNLDIPLNLKYSLSRDPHKVFITAGLSSFTYLNESYRYDYNSVNPSTGKSSPSRNVVNKNFGKFDLAQTFNLSLGLTRKGRFQDMVFEPFLKYPLGTLGSQNIRFGSAGINLKINIKTGRDSEP